MIRFHVIFVWLVQDGWQVFHASMNCAEKRRFTTSVSRQDLRPVHACPESYHCYHHLSLVAHRTQSRYKTRATRIQFLCAPISRCIPFCCYSILFCSQLVGDPLNQSVSLSMSSWAVWCGVCTFTYGKSHFSCRSCVIHCY